MKTPAAPSDPTHRGDTLSFALAFRGIGHSLVFGIWPLGHSPKVLTFPSQVPAFTIFTPKKLSRSIRGPFLFPMSPSHPACGIAKSLRSKMSTFPLQVPDLTLFNPFYPRPHDPKRVPFSALDGQIKDRSGQIISSAKPSLTPDTKELSVKRQEYSHFKRTYSATDLSAFLGPNSKSAKSLSCTPKTSLTAILDLPRLTPIFRIVSKKFSDAAGLEITQRISHIERYSMRRAFSSILLVLSMFAPLASQAAPATFFRAINLNGPAVSIDGYPWEADKPEVLKAKGSSFENQAVPLKPPTDPDRTKMIRSSRWGSSLDLEVLKVPDAEYQVFVYVWEDNHNERFDILLNDKPVLEGFHSGTAGNWKKLGPWKASPKDGTLKISARSGAANLSGIEIWSGAGEVPSAPAPSFVTELTPEHTEFFEKRIRPVLANNCYECHSAGAKKIGNNLLLDSRAGVIKGGDTGPVVYPGLPESSLLIHAVRHKNPDLTMPPKKKLSALEIGDLEQWVKLGAPDPRTNDTVSVVKTKSRIDWDKARQWWSFRPLEPAKIPSVKNTSWPANDVDRFILARLEKEQIKPASDANRRALIRRATFDLIGLPPTPEEVESFVNDKSPNAFARVVDRLLDSPHYGERWGRHWLDVVRYADSAGDNSDFPIPQMYRYRNWVINALNRDMPYDQFIREQVAGDLLKSENEEEKKARLIATGYIANARRFGSRVSDYPQHLTIEDTIDNLGRSFLGLTVSCARCHDHKFDPIPTTDYYALYGFFDSTRYPWPGIELDKIQRDLVPLVSDDEVNVAKKARQEKEKELQAVVSKYEKELKAGEGDEKKKLEKSLAEAKKDLEKHRNSALPYEQAYAVSEAEKSANAAVQIKGDPAKVGDVVPRRFLTVLNGAELRADTKGSGRRQLADWIADAKNPLTARVMVNRIWLNHFGKGIVPTPNDFGKQGKPPTHPELLDYLADRFIASGWSIKSMHRLIMLSRTYQLSSERNEDALAKDANNDLLSAFPRRRLDAEAIRDTLLVLGDNIDRSPGGPHPFAPQHEWNYTQHNPFKAVYETKRRSIYLMTQRIQRHPYLAIFDGADPSASTAFRMTSTTPLQALYLLNDPFIHEQSQKFANRILSESSDEKARLNRAYQLALGRPPQPDELERGHRFLASVADQLRSSETPPGKVEREAWTAMSRVLFRLNEFVYID
jgi:hypothetical protein